MPRGVAQLGSALRSGRRGRRFKSCHPDPSPQVSDLRKRRVSAACVPLQAPSRRPEGTKKEHEGTPGKADPTAQQRPSGHSGPLSATKRPPGRNTHPPGSSADPKSVKLVRLGTVRERPNRRKIQSTIAPPKCSSSGRPSGLRAMRGCARRQRLRVSLVTEPPCPAVATCPRWAAAHLGQRVSAKDPQTTIRSGRG